MSPLHKDKMVMYVDDELVFRAHMQGAKDTYKIRELDCHLGSRMIDRLPLPHGSRDGLLTQQPYVTLCIYLYTAASGKKFD